MRPGADAPQARRLRFLFDPFATLAALAQQRRRFAATVADLSAEELASPSRCAGWTVADVLRHLVWADAAMRGLWSDDQPSLSGFDPRTTPDLAVQADRAVSDEEIRLRYLSSTDAMVLELDPVDPERLGRPSVSPAGRVPWWLSAVHLCWDSTIHERDVVVPLGRPVVDVAPETAAGLGYSLALASFFDGPDPLYVEIGVVRLRSGDGSRAVWAADGGGAGDDAEGSPGACTVLSTVDVPSTVDALCGRGALADVLDGDPTVVERLGGLAAFFTTPV